MLTKYYGVMDDVSETKAYPEAIAGTTGLLSRPEAEWLRRIPMVLGPGLYADLGTYRGRSACLMADTIQKFENSKLVTVDMFDDRGLSRRFHTPGDKCQLVKDLFVARGFNCVEVIQSETAAAAAAFSDGTFNLVFIDADHSYHGVKKDFLAWEGKVKQDGVIAFHDSHVPGVAKLLSEISWIEFDRVDTLSVWRRHGSV